MDNDIVESSYKAYFEEFFLPSIVSVAFDSSSSGDDVDPGVSHRRIRLAGGARTGIEWIALPPVRICLR